MGWCPNDFLLLSLSLFLRCCPDDGNFIFQLFLCSHNNCRLFQAVKRKRKPAHTQQLEKESCYCYDNECLYTYVYTYSKEVLLTIRRKKYGDDDARDFKCRNYIRVGHEIQLNEYKDDEVIQIDVCFCLKVEHKKKKGVEIFVYIK